MNRTLILREMGLIFKWQAEFEADTKPCYDSNGNNNRLAKDKTKHKSSLARLSLANLGGAFAVLGVGILISALVFLVEMLHKFLC
jgi:hypothetical protein